MEKEEFINFFNEECEKINIKVNEKQQDMFYNYMIGSLEWNEKVNITAIREEKDFIIKHYIDSLTINKLLKDADRVIDIGTGGGFPGVPIKIMNENIEVTLIDSINKKLNVIRDLTSKIKLKKLDIIHTRAEYLAQDKKYREMFDVATTRAVSNFTTIMEYMMPFVKVGGNAICMKGPNYKEELEEAQKAIEILGGKVEYIETINIGDEERNIIIVKKVKSTPNKYPRGQGKPLKEPIR